MFVHVRLRSGKTLGSVGITGGELMSEFAPSLLTYDKEAGAYVLDDEKLVAESEHVQGLEAQDDQEELQADPLGLCCGLEHNCSSSSNSQALKWARDFQAQQREEASRLNRENGPQFQFGSQNTSKIVIPELPDFSGLAQ